MTLKSDFTSVLYSNKYSRVKVYLPEYPLYPARSDTYNNSTQEAAIDPKHISQQKTDLDTELNTNEQDVGGNDTHSISTLVIPGSALDDEQEAIGTEEEDATISV